MTRLPKGCTVVEEDTGSKTEAAFRIECRRKDAEGPMYPLVGRIKIHKLRQKIRGKTVYSVDGVNIDERFQRRGFATLLYENAAREACSRRARLASTERNFEAHSLSFWRKQVRKGRAERVPQRHRYGANTERSPGMYDAFVLDCDHASDLGELPARRIPGWALAGAAATLLVIRGQL